MPTGSRPARSTTRHIVDDAASRGQQLAFRINTDQGVRYVEVNDPWLVPDRPGIDVAIIPAAFPESLHHAPIDLDLVATDEKLAEFGVGIGDELFMVGLFTERSGEQRNAPVVRSGVIAQMPGEPLIDVDTGHEYEAYLAEIRSIRGYSGSPVFVALPMFRPYARDEHRTQHVVMLLGVMRGHYAKRLADGLEFSSDDLREMHYGMSVVTPIREVMALLMGDDQRRLRREWDTQLLKERAPIND